jgi:catechol 2,3-dioxygenase-like lactoylglutathione lyase family enzyme
MRLERIDHVVFTVRDINTTCDFYSRALGRAIERSSSRDHKTL